MMSTKMICGSWSLIFASAAQSLASSFGGVSP
jgi:hypothetical protein